MYQIACSAGIFLTFAVLQVEGEVDPASYAVLVRDLEDTGATVALNDASSNEGTEDVHAGGEDPSSGVLVESLIAAGSPATSTSEFPFMASIIIDGIHSCGAALIHPRVLLSAAHCFWDRDNQQIIDIVPVKVRIGSIRRASGGVMRKVTRVTIPAHYNPETYFGDIALIQLDKSVSEFSKSYMANMKSIGKTLTAVGYGINPSGFLSNTLQWVELPTLSESVCNTADKTYDMPTVPKDHFCAGLGEDGGETCIGDSGGPLLMPSATYTRAIGITSFGPRDGKCGVVGKNIGAYTSVYYWRSWIEDTLSIFNMRG